MNEDLSNSWSSNEDSIARVSFAEKVTSASTEQYINFKGVRVEYFWELAISARSITILPTNFIWSGRLLEMRLRCIRDYFLRYCLCVRWYSISEVKMRVSFRSTWFSIAFFLPIIVTALFPFIVFHSIKKRAGKRRFTLDF